MNYWKRLNKVITEKGITALPKVICRKIHYHFSADRRFDIKQGVDTCGFKSVSDLDIHNSLKSISCHYEPSSVKLVRSMLKSLPIDHSKFTFIDYGSGRGRVLLLASEYPYEKIIGVELAQSLHMTACKNITKWKSKAKQCNNIKSLNMNAVEFELPANPLVLYFFTPFIESAFDSVVNKILEQLKNNRYPIYIIYSPQGFKYKEHTDMLSKLDLDCKEISLPKSLFATGKLKSYLLFFRSEHGSDF